MGKRERERGRGREGKTGKHVIYCLPHSTVHTFSYANAALCWAEEIAINQLSIGQLEGK